MVVELIKLIVYILYRPVANVRDIMSIVLSNQLGANI